MTGATLVRGRWAYFAAMKVRPLGLLPTGMVVNTFWAAVSITVTLLSLVLVTI